MGFNMPPSHNTYLFSMFAGATISSYLLAMSLIAHCRKPFAEVHDAIHRCRQ